ncbi:ADP-ribosylglycohydrolase family protein [Lachnospiraceae bacterium LCP25S3_G4]
MIMKKDYIERIYAGWLGKIIGIRMGAPVEGWSYEQIKDIYGELDGYPVDYKEFAADDDSNGPFFFLRALEDCGKGADMEAQDVAEALLNYAPFEHGFFWWGGYGVSTEHTAYLNLKNGIKAPRSGSIEQNGHVAAEQIGGQIFIDTWGLVTPGNPDLAVALARKAASVTHGGNGVYGGIFVAACISFAFVEQNVHKIIKKGLSYIPEECEYAKVVRSVMDYHEKHSESWEDCYQFIFEHFGYDKYPGVCHIIPNIAVMILSLLYGKGDFAHTLNICNRCGWDTDCNVGNLGTLMGVRGGLGVIDYNKWRKPINDFLACSSVVGSLNIMDIPYGASYIVKLAAALAGEELPEPYNDICSKRIDSCHFEYPGSTHAIRVRSEHLHTSDIYPELEYHLINTDESSATGSRSLKVTANVIQGGENLFIYKKTYYGAEDFHNSRYDPAFSPIAYPGQMICGSVMLPQYGNDVLVSLYAKERHTQKIYQGKVTSLKKGQWKNLTYQIPALDGGLIEEIGFCIHAKADRGKGATMAVLIDDLYVDGKPCYSIQMENEKEECWTIIHREITQFTRLKGLFYLEEGMLHLSCGDFGEVYTGKYDWKDYRAEFVIMPLTGETHMVNVRVQGASRSYAAALLPDGKVGILKNENGYRLLTMTDFLWERGYEYKLEVQVEHDIIYVGIDGKEVLSYQDNENPYLEGAIGLGVLEGSHIGCRHISIS